MMLDFECLNLDLFRPSYGPFTKVRSVRPVQVSSVRCDYM